MECILDKFLLATEIFYSSKQITLENIISNMLAICSVEATLENVISYMLAIYSLANPSTYYGIVTLYGNTDLGQHWLR